MLVLFKYTSHLQVVIHQSKTQIFDLGIYFISRYANLPMSFLDWKAFQDSCAIRLWEG